MDIRHAVGPIQPEYRDVIEVVSRGHTPPAKDRHPGQAVIPKPLLSFPPTVRSRRRRHPHLEMSLFMNRQRVTST